MNFQRWLFSLLIFSPTSLLLADDWPQWRGPQRDAKSAEAGLFGNWDADGPPLAWTTAGIGEGYASVAVVGDRIYTTGNLPNGQVVSAIDVANGKLVWQQQVTRQPPQHGYEGSRCTPAVDGNRLYVVTSSGGIICLQTATGKIVWQRDFADWNGKMMSGWGFSESPLVDGNRVICTPGGNKGTIVALNKVNGKEIWASQLPNFPQETGVNGDNLSDGAGYGSVVVSNGAGVKQYIQLVGRGLIGIRASDGAPLWRYSKVANGTANIPTAVVDGDLVFTSTAYGTGSALLRLTKKGNQVQAEEVYWLDARTLQNKHGGMVLVDGHIYCGTGNGEGLPTCLNMQTGEIAWGPERGKGRGEASLIYADGHLVIRRDDGTVMLVVATPEKFELKHSFMPEVQEGKSWAHPVIAGGRFYLREQNRLMAYELRSQI
ncbi:PQQ-binding-like beta-propeller repeat protein [Planctomycetaceae bacterium SH139]